MKMSKTYFDNYQFEHDYSIYDISPNKPFTDMLQGYLFSHRPRKTLDIGCGTAPVTGKYSQERFVVGVDINKKDLKNAERFRGLNRVMADACTLCFKDGSFDFVICTEVMEHVPSTGALLSAISTASTDGGLILISLPNGRSPVTFLYDHVRERQSVRKSLRLKRKFDPGFKHHYHEFSIHSLKRTLSSHFDIIEIRNVGFGFKIVNRTIKNLNPSLFRSTLLRNILKSAVLMDIWLSKLDFCHMLTEQWIVLCRKKSVS
jgi:SAM-dependent methyltransferase